MIKKKTLSMMLLSCHMTNRKKNSMRVNMRMIKNANEKNERFKILKITTYHFEEEADDRSNVRKMICLPNRKTMMMKLMRSQLENIMEIKVMKKMKQLTI